MCHRCPVRQDCLDWALEAGPVAGGVGRHFGERRAGRQAPSVAYESIRGGSQSVGTTRQGGFVGRYVCWQGCPLIPCGHATDTGGPVHLLRRVRGDSTATPLELPAVRRRTGCAGCRHS
ncbi:WhiB family transcriptional regulator [Streptomyces clavifer]|uniref:WhiB family transcriptional regulator n=1 Tax=Streptomyces clavifer TaxID=68188 RepID=UPI0036A537E5